MDTVAINQSFITKLPYWGDLEKLSKDDKITLIALLSLSIADTTKLAPQTETKALKLDQAMALLDKMMVKGGKPVPADKDGKGALGQIVL